MVAPKDEGVVWRMVNPSRVSSSGRADPEGVFRTWSFPRGDKPLRIWVAREVNRDPRVSYSDVERRMWAEENLSAVTEVAMRERPGQNQSLPSH